MHPPCCAHLSHLSVVCLQLVQKFKLLLVVGRRLVFPTQSSAAVSADMTTQVQFQAADGTTAMRTVSLMFPANCRTVVRLMEAWYDAQVSLSMLDGRQFVYIMDGRAAGRGGPPSTRGGGGRDSPPPFNSWGAIGFIPPFNSWGVQFIPPHEPAPCCCCLGAQMFRYHQQSRRLHWPCHAAKATLPPPCILHTCYTVITGEALPGIIRQLLCHAMHQSNPPSSLRTSHLPHCDHKRRPCQPSFSTCFAMPCTTATLPPSCTLATHPHSSCSCMRDT
jgi:hypothetical protein